MCSVRDRAARAVSVPGTAREFADQHIDSVFPLAGPLHDGRDERRAAAAHGAGGGVGAGFAI